MHATRSLGVLAISLAALHLQGKPASGSALLDGLCREVQARTRVAEPGRADLDQFENWAVSGEPLLRNPRHWLRGVDLTFISAGSLGPQGEWSRKGCAILLTPSHVSMATHDVYPVGQYIVWVAEDGRKIVRRLAAFVPVAGSDIAVGLLDRAIGPEEIKPAAIIRKGDLLAELAAERFRDPQLPKRWVPVLASNRDRSLTLSILRSLGPRILVTSTAEASAEPRHWQNYYVAPVSGTSGSPLFWVLDGKVALLGHLSTAKPDSGPFYGEYLAGIEAAIAQMPRPEALTFTPLRLNQAQDHSAGLPGTEEVAVPTTPGR